MKKNRWILIGLGLAGLLLGGCQLMNQIFGPTDGQVEEAMKAALNALADTYPTAPPDSVYLDEWGTTHYTSADGSYQCEFTENAGTVRHIFKDYRPQFSSYVINGELSPTPMPFASSGEFNYKVEGGVELSGGPITSLQFDLSTHGFADSYTVTALDKVVGSVTADGKTITHYDGWDVKDVVNQHLSILLSIAETARKS